MNKHNHIAVWAMIVAHQALGFLWYSPALFMNAWMAGQNRTAEQMDMSDPRPFVWDIITTIIAAYALSWLVRMLAADTFVKGAIIGMIVFFGFVLQAVGTHYKFLGIADSVLFIDLGVNFVWLTLAGGVFAIWPRKTVAA